MTTGPKAETYRAEIAAEIKKLIDLIASMDARFDRIEQLLDETLKHIKEKA